MKKNLLLILLALIATTTVQGARFISDILLIGGNWDEVCREEKIFQAQGWETINKDLNEGCGESSDYIYLMVKYEESDGVNYGYITDLYLSTEIPEYDCFIYKGNVYYLTPYFGGGHFKYKQGNLNSHTGDSSDNIYLYYTKGVKNNEALTSISFNSTRSGAIGKNGSNDQGYDLNDGAHGSYIYMHTTTSRASYASLTGSGMTKDDPIIINSAAEWAAVANKMNNYEYSNDIHYFRLESDIPNEREKAAGRTAITFMAGQKDVSSLFTLDGNNHTMNVDINNVVQGTAPFSHTVYANIENLTVTGNVTSTNHHAGGLIGVCQGNTIIQNCHISTKVESPTYAGGVIANGGSNQVFLNKTYFDGTITGFKNYAAGLIGWCDAAKINIFDCLFKGSFEPEGAGLYHPIACRDPKQVVTLSNCNAYFLESFDTINIGNYTIPGMNAIKVSREMIPGVPNMGFISPDGFTYYYPYANYNDFLAQLVKDHAGSKATLEITFSMVKDKLLMKCLPMRISSIDDCTIYKLNNFSRETVNGVATWTATFCDVTPDQDQFMSTEPDMPYLIAPNISGPMTFSGVIDAVPNSVSDFKPIQLDGGNGWSMTGVYSNVKASSIFGHLYASGQVTLYNKVTGEEAFYFDALLPLNSEQATLASYDGYVSYNPEDSDGSIPSFIMIDLVDKLGNVTAVGTINTVTGEITIDRWYNLNGTPLKEQPTEPGIYIHNGKKIAIQ